MKLTTILLTTLLIPLATASPLDRIVVPTLGFPDTMCSDDLSACGLVLMLTDCNTTTLVTATATSLPPSNLGPFQRDWQLVTLIRTDQGDYTYTDTATFTSHPIFLQHNTHPGYVQDATSTLLQRYDTNSPWQIVARSVLLTAAGC
jgi:hypothetical protein